MLRITICDDNDHHRRLLKQYIQKYAKINDLEINIKMFASAITLINYLEEKPKVDVFFMDVEMPALNGIDGSIKIRKYYDTAMLVFITGYRDFAIDAFKVDATDYILKPITYSSIEAMLNHLIIKINKQKGSVPKKFVFKSNGETHAIDYNQIIYFEKYLRKYKVHTAKGTYDFYMSYKDLENHLDFSYFVKCHQSYVVSIERIKFYKNQEIYLIGTDEIIPVSKTYIKDVKVAIKSFILT